MCRPCHEAAEVPRFSWSSAALLSRVGQSTSRQCRRARAPEGCRYLLGVATLATAAFVRRVHLGSFRAFSSPLSRAAPARHALSRRRPAARSARSLRAQSSTATSEPGAQDVDDLFKSLETELSRYTPLRDDLSFLIAEGRDSAHMGLDAGIQKMCDLLAWLRTKREPGVRLPSSQGPLAVATLREAASGSEIVVLGTPHGVPGLLPEKNPVPLAVRQTILKLRPDLIAVELDKARGVKELEKLPSALWGRAAMLLPADEPQVVDTGAASQLRLDQDLVERIKSSFGAGLGSPETIVQAVRDIFSQSSDSSLAMNVLALYEFRFRKVGDWGRDATAAVEAAAKVGKPLLLCDFPQEWTLGKVVPLYNEAWVRARQQRLEYLNDGSRAVRALVAEEKILAECVLSGHGGDLPLFDYGLGLCRPAVGLVEADARALWLNERDPAMAAAVASAVGEGRARSASGGPASLKAAKRAVLVVGCNHVEGVARCLESTHGYVLVSEPVGGWEGSAAGKRSTPSSPGRRGPSSMARSRGMGRGGKRGGGRRR